MGEIADDILNGDRYDVERSGKTESLVLISCRNRILPCPVFFFNKKGIL